MHSTTDWRRSWIDHWAARCHGTFDAKPEPPPLDSDFAEQLSKADEHIREHQQGKGRPIIAFKNATHQIVAVGKTVHWSDKWENVP